ncbi:MAG: hypothetical protein HZA31_03635 [Opitutae bacterium]|nr:hypothetical protein [Opitutae bacterium]
MNSIEARPPSTHAAVVGRVHDYAAEKDRPIVEAHAEPVVLNALETIFSHKLTPALLPDIARLWATNPTSAIWTRAYATATEIVTIPSKGLVLVHQGLRAHSLEDMRRQQVQIHRYHDPFRPSEAVLEKMLEQSVSYGGYEEMGDVVQSGTTVRIPFSRIPTSSCYHNDFLRRDIFFNSCMGGPEATMLFLSACRDRSLAYISFLHEIPKLMRLEQPTCRLIYFERKTNEVHSNKGLDVREGRFIGVEPRKTSEEDVSSTVELRIAPPLEVTEPRTEPLSSGILKASDVLLDLRMKLPHITDELFNELLSYFSQFEFRLIPATR